MTARATMANLITELRGMTNAGANDYTVNNVDYWSDDQLQTILDRHRTEVVNEPLVHIDEVEPGGALSITRYYSRHGNYEATQGGTALFVLRDHTWNVAGTALYTADYARGEVIFSANQALPGNSVSYYLTGRSYDLNAAAADVWDRKAAQVVSASYSWSTDNMSVNKTAQRQEAVEMARYYRGLAGPQSITLQRSDTDA